MDQSKAVLRSVRLSTFKGRLVADLIRGHSVSSASNLLRFSNLRAASIMNKVLESAIANAEHNLGLDVDSLYVKTVMVEQATPLRRFSARAKGRGNRILKRTSHVFLTLAQRG